jgi:hypothetical protein
MKRIQYVIDATQTLIGRPRVAILVMGYLAGRGHQKTTVAEAVRSCGLHSATWDYDDPELVNMVERLQALYMLAGANQEVG